MVLIRQAVVAAACIASAVAVDVIVQSSGGNVTGKFGHPYGYGFLHEVRVRIFGNLITSVPYNN
jgi:alpha-L-arabinofuranosidase